MSSDRETRRRLEEVQTRLVELGPELELTESPGFTDQVLELERTLSLAGQRTTRAEERLTLARSELASASRSVEEMTLAAQARQTERLPSVLSALLLLAMLAGVVMGAIWLATSGSLSRPGVVGICLSCAFALGVTLRARVRPRRPRPRFQ